MYNPLNKEDANKALVELTRKYVNDPAVVTDIMNRIQELSSPPAREVIDEIYNSLTVPISKEDKNKIDDLMHYFG